MQIILFHFAFWQFPLGQINHSKQTVDNNQLQAIRKQQASASHWSMWYQLTSATKLTMLMLKLTVCREFINSWGSIQGMESNHADTYIIGAERKVLITIPDVTC